VIILMALYRLHSAAIFLLAVVVGLLLLFLGVTLPDLIYNYSFYQSNYKVCQ